MCLARMLKNSYLHTVRRTKNKVWIEAKNPFIFPFHESHQFKYPGQTLVLWSYQTWICLFTNFTKSGHLGINNNSNFIKYLLPWLPDGSRSGSIWIRMVEINSNLVHAIINSGFPFRILAHLLNQDLLLKEVCW